MKLRDIIAAVRGYQETRGDLEAAKIELARSEQEKAALEDRCEKLNDAGLDQQYEIQHLQTKTEALTSALNAFCPRLESTNELKRFYDTISPSLDEDGYKLFDVAKKLTGINVYSEYPYEDNLGHFETADGHTMLGYLIASRFNAVEWDIVPGTSYERSTLRDVDRTTPEYKAFEKQLYTETLKTLGFEKVLPSEQRTGKEQKIERRAAHER